MKESDVNIRELLAGKGLKVTPQRVVVMEVLLALRNHPAAETISDMVKEKNPNISLGTIYSILETFTQKGLITRVKTEKDKMRYDAILEKHHHFYDIESDRIIDFYDDELNKMIEDYLNKKKLTQFDIHDVKLQINGIYKG